MCAIEGQLCRLGRTRPRWCQSFHSCQKAGGARRESLTDPGTSQLERTRWRQECLTKGASCQGCEWLLTFSSLDKTVKTLFAEIEIPVSQPRRLNIGR